MSSQAPLSPYSTAVTAHNLTLECPPPGPHLSSGTPQPPGAPVSGPRGEGVQPGPALVPAATAQTPSTRSDPHTSTGPGLLLPQPPSPLREGQGNLTHPGWAARGLPRAQHSPQNRGARGGAQKDGGEKWGRNPGPSGKGGEERGRTGWGAGGGRAGRGQRALSSRHVHRALLTSRNGHFFFLQR